MITILAVICGADEFTEIEEYGKSKEEFLVTFLDLPNGIPSHDTFGRVFAVLDPDEFRTCETKVHWVLDVAFREDDSRVRMGHADENLAIVRHIALNKLKNEKFCKRGVKGKRKKAGWDEEYLLKVLAA